MLRWPLPALLTWAACWALARALTAVQAPAWTQWALPMAMGAVLALWPRIAATGWRQVFVALGFPLSLLAAGQGASWPAWAWLLPLAVLLLAYPVRAWRDAPVFPTPADALRELPRHLQLPADAVVLDAGCGAGHGLIALHQALSSACPQLRLQGVEHSWLWWAVSAWRCRGRAQVRRGDMWADDWAALDLVYLFQRPETMPRAWAKARAEMRSGRWLLSLEFEAFDEQGQRVRPHAHWRAPSGDGGHDGKPVWLYRLP